MPSKNEKTIRAYKFFTDKERSQNSFTLEDIAKASGWSIGTTRTYRTKKWHFFLKEGVHGYFCEGLLDVSQDAFIRIHAQRTDISTEILRPRFTPKVDALIDKARESCLLAVQVYNNPLVTFRTPGYIVHMMIAYTSLFHAVFERNGIEYWYKDSTGKDKIIDDDYYAWDVSECVKRYYKGNTTPQSENIKFFINIRNKIEHRFVPALDTTLSGKCQALLMNFEELLLDEFGKFFVLGQNLALALQFSVYSAEQQKALRKIQSADYNAIRKYTDNYDSILPKEITQSMHYSFRAFLIPKIGNHAKSSDIALEFVSFDPENPNEMEQYEKNIALLKEKRVPVANQGKLKATEVVKSVKEVTGLNFNMSHHTRACKVYEVRPAGYKADGCKTEYCQFDEVFRQYIYTEAWVELLCDKLKDPDEFQRIRVFRSS